MESCNARVIAGLKTPSASGMSLFKGGIFSAFTGGKMFLTYFAMIN